MTTIFLSGPSREMVVHEGIKEEHNLRLTPIEWLDSLHEMYLANEDMIKGTHSPSHLFRAYHDDASYTCEMAFTNDIVNIASIYTYARALTRRGYAKSIFGIAFPLSDHNYRALKREFLKKRTPSIFGKQFKVTNDLLKNLNMADEIRSRLDVAVNILPDNKEEVRIHPDPLIFMMVKGKNKAAMLNSNMCIDPYYEQDSHVFIFKQKALRWWSD